MGLEGLVVVMGLEGLVVVMGLEGLVVVMGLEGLVSRRLWPSPTVGAALRRDTATDDGQSLAHAICMSSAGAGGGLAAR